MANRFDRGAIFHLTKAFVSMQWFDVELYDKRKIMFVSSILSAIIILRSVGFLAGKVLALQPIHDIQVCSFGLSALALFVGFLRSSLQTKGVN